MVPELMIKMPIKASGKTRHLRHRHQDKKSYMAKN
jgi:hypothetical protein